MCKEHVVKLAEKYEHDFELEHGREPTDDEREALFSRAFEDWPNHTPEPDYDGY